MPYIVLAVFAAVHALFSILNVIPHGLYLYYLRPLLFAGLSLLFHFTRSRGSRIYKGQHAVLAVGLTIALYITVFFLVGIFFGFARNMMVTGLRRGLDNLWIYGSFALLSEVLRFKLIKDPAINKNMIKIAIVTGIFCFSQINNFTFDANFFFTLLMPVVVFNVILSYIAIDGTLIALILLRCAFELTPVLMPVIPNIDHKIWVIIVEMIMVTTAVIYRYFMPPDQNARREVKLPFWRRYAVTFASCLAVYAFTAGLFPLYPTIIVTDSMAGAVDKGSIALVRKVNEKNMYSKINEGDIIHFINRQNITVVHRVIEKHGSHSSLPYFTTKGDANERDDPDPVPANRVKGIVFGSIPHIGQPRVLVNQLFR